jgi:hypothetical protein
MKTFLLLLISVMLLIFAGCDQVPSRQKGTDGYYFEKETFIRTEFPVKIVLFSTSKELQVEYTRLAAVSTVVGKPTTKNVVAFAVLNKNNTTCTIYMVDPKVRYQPEFIGHEFVHCIYGAWHREPQS